MLRAFILFCLIVLVSCTNVVPSTIASLAGFDPLTADPQDFAVAIDIPDGAVIQPESAVLTLSATAPGKSAVSKSVTLQETPAPNGVIYAIRETDLLPFRETQAAIQALKATDPEGTKGSLAVKMVACAVGSGPLPDATVDIAIRVDATGPFLPLVRDLPVADVLAQAQSSESCSAL